ncbi:MAG TPA: DUF1801 domain-containing protein [Chthoniobacter sp.]|jgi:uncharacterized protein YdeI (YjbR/CyaY-like superfamily)
MERKTKIDAGKHQQGQLNPKVDEYFKRAKKWKEEMEKLRTIVLDGPLTEELKWGKPCYTFEGSNIVLIIGFKDHCVLLFCKGALLKDPHGLLIRPTENTQAARQMRFKNLQEVVKRERSVKAFLHEAVEAEKAGLEVEYKKSTELVIPEELRTKWEEIPALKTAFAALTPGRQRAYVLYFSAAKQSKTREARVEKCLPQILAGKGLDDEYRSKKK